DRGYPAVGIVCQTGKLADLTDEKVQALWSDDELSSSIPCRDGITTRDERDGSQDFERTI
ncbi:MAG: hypothetical protein ACRD2A_15355, partial [Vicinamibacterales bacterium]